MQAHLDHISNHDRYDIHYECLGSLSESDLIEHCRTKGYSLLAMELENILGDDCHE